MHLDFKWRNNMNNTKLSVRGKIKPVKMWGLISPNGIILDVFEVKWLAQLHCFCGYKIIPVLISPLPVKKSKPPKRG